MWRYFLALNIVALLSAGAYFFFTEYRRVTGFAPNSWTEDVESDCAVVLTGGPGRVREGLDLLYRGSVKKLIISGVHPKVGLRDIVPLWSIYSGLKEEDVVLERRSGTTYGNALQSLPLVEALHCRSIVLVTSHLHMQRSLRTFRNLFPPDFVIYPYAIVGGDLRPTAWDGSLETVKSLFYSLWVY